MTEPAPEPEETQVERLRRLSGFTLTPPKGQPGFTGPDCIWCNAPTQRAGSCFVCPSCGASTSC